MNEIEEVLKILLDKIKSYYGKLPEQSFNGKSQINRLYFSQQYGYGEFIDPKTDISFSSDIIGRLNESNAMTRCAKRIIIVKRGDFNRFNEMCAEFTHKANRYIQLLNKTEQSMPTFIRDILKIYQGIALNFYYSYKYVVE